MIQILLIRRNNPQRFLRILIFADIFFTTLLEMKILQNFHEFDN
jgi:hypothetical protein